MNRKALFGSMFLSACCTVPAVAAPDATLDGIALHGAMHAAFEGREWGISQYYNHQALLSPHPQLVRVTDPYISFAHGIIQGAPGCGKFTGTYRRSGDVLTIAAKWSDDT
jgi:hypothetical protein